MKVKQMVQIEFDAPLKQHEGMNASYIEPPFDVEETFGAKRVKVLATFDGLEYRGSIVRMGGIFMLGVTQEIRRAIGKGFGDTVHVTLMKDETERTVELPAELASLLDSSPAALANYRSMPYSAQKDFATWIAEGAKQETRTTRARKAYEQIQQNRRLK